MTFDSLGLNGSICRALLDEGYKSPTPIQQSAIPALLAGSDVLASAETGTGKTAAYLLPMLERLSSQSAHPGKGPRALILAPTRELAHQIATASLTYGRYMKKVRTTVIVGGVPYEPQKRELKNFVDILVATPGRLLDHLRDEKVDLRRMELLVLDEADRMLDMGFLEDVKSIISAIKSDRQTVLFSATFGGKVKKLAESITRNPKVISIPSVAKKEQLISQTTRHTKSVGDKRGVLKDILRAPGLLQAIVFTSTKRGAEELSYYLKDEGVNAAALHGDMRQRERAKTLGRMRDQKFQVLVATDVAARGIDIESISHVVNFDIPRTSEDYIHRIGRTGRAGARGSAVTLVAPSERRRFAFIERALNGKTNPRNVRP